MGLLKKLQEVLLKRDLCKSAIDLEYLADKYPMSLLVEYDVFKRYKDTELFYQKEDKDFIYNLQGEFLGTQLNFFGESDNDYIIVKKLDGKFENGTENNTYAVYDKSGNCIVPHNCYSNCFITDDYVILSLSMKCSDLIEREERIEKSAFEDETVYLNGQVLKDVLGGSLRNPKALIVSKNKIVTTNYLSVKPLKPYGEENPYPNNVVWISQTEKGEEVTFKLDKNLHITETYRFPLYSHMFESFFIDCKTQSVYLLDSDNKRRVNLRTGVYVNLLTLKRKRLSKQERLSDHEINEENIASEVVEVETEDEKDDKFIVQEN